MFRTSSVHHQERFVQAVFAALVCGNTRLLDTSSPYDIPNLRIQLVKKVPEDGPVRSETCRANTRDE